jgi:REP element-mobilizing transposase RayT
MIERGMAHPHRAEGDHDMRRIRRRRSIRLPGYDYSQAGAYFVTICTHRRRCLLGEIREAEVHLFDLGRVVVGCWEEIPRHFPHLSLDAWIVMPNHVHGILVISEYPIDDETGHACDAVGARHASPLPTIIGAFKSAAARRINDRLATPGAPVWQRGYYEHVVRNERALHRLRQYIAANPERWPHDRENPNRRGRRGPAV